MNTHGAPIDQAVCSVVRYYAFGGPEVLTIDQTRMPVVHRGQALIEVAASSINAMDSRVRLGKLPFLGYKGFPMGIGYDYAGVVRVAPQGDRRLWLREGARVWGCLTTPLIANQAMATHIVTRPMVISPAPSTLPLTQVAALPVAGMTAMKSLQVLGFRPGQRLLVVGGNGGVGTAAIAMARHYSDTVDAVVGHNHEAARQAGAGETFSYHEVDPADIPGQYDAVLGATEIKNLAAYRHLVAPGGTIATIAPTHPPTLVEGMVTPGPRIRIVTALPNAKALMRLTKMVEAGVLTPVIGQTYRLHQVVQAFTDAETTSACGKRVVVINDQLN